MSPEPRTLEEKEHIVDQIVQFSMDQLDYSKTWCDDLTREWYETLFRSWLSEKLPEHLK